MIHLSQALTWLRALVPAAIAIMLIVLSHLPFGIDGGLLPAFGLIAVYYWTVNNPRIMSAGVAFVVGLVADILGGTPLGLSALILVLLQYATMSQRRAFVGRPFVVAWFGFALLASAATVLIWFGASLYHLNLFDPAAAGLQLLITLATYPLLAELFGWFGRRLAIPGEG